MKKILMFTYSIVAYLIAFGSILFWIASVGNLIPEIGIDQEPQMSFLWALLNNLLLISLFGVQHSVMARKWFKDLFAKYFPRPIERSTFVLLSGILLFNLGGGANEVLEDVVCSVEVLETSVGNNLSLVEQDDAIHALQERQVVSDLHKNSFYHLEESCITT